MSDQVIVDVLSSGKLTVTSRRSLFLLEVTHDENPETRGFS